MNWASNHPSRSGIDMGLNFGDDGKKRQEDLALFRELVAQGYPQDQVAYFIDQRNKTGKLDFNLPNFQNDLHEGTKSKNKVDARYFDPRSNRPVPLPPMPSADIPERSTLQNFQPMGQEAIGTVDVQNPDRLNLLPVPQGVNVRSVMQVNKPHPDKNPPKTPEEAAAINEIKIFQKKAASKDANGDPYEFTSDDIDRVNNAAETLGIPYTPGQEKQQNWWQKFIGKSAGVTPPVLFKTNGAKTTETGTGGYQSAEDVRSAVKSGKLSRDQAIKILRDQFGYK